MHTDDTAPAAGEPAYDTPIHRATILQMQVDQLDEMLIAMRARRMEQVKKLEVLARIKADDAILSVFIKLEKAIAKAKRALDKAASAEATADAALHKARLLAIECSVT